MARTWPLNPNAPNAQDATLARWRTDGRVRAIGALALAGGAMRGTDLAKILGISPRGLRTFLLKDDLIVAEINQDERRSDRGCTWYRLNQAKLPPPPSPNPICIGEDRPPRKRLNFGNRGAVALRITRLESQS